MHPSDTPYAIAVLLVTVACDAALLARAVRDGRRRRYADSLIAFGVFVCLSGATLAVGLEIADGHRRAALAGWPILPGLLLVGAGWRARHFQLLRARWVSRKRRPLRREDYPAWSPSIPLLLILSAGNAIWGLATRNPSRVWAALLVAAVGCALLQTFHRYMMGVDIRLAERWRQDLRSAKR